MTDAKRLIQSTTVGIADGIAVATLRPDWPQLARDVAAPHRWLDRVGADQAALTLALAALWCAALWLAVGLVAIAAGALPGRAGGLARCVAHRVLPAVVLRAVAGVAGLGVLVAPVAPAVAGAATPPGATPPATTRLAPPPVWPTDSPGPHIGWPTSPHPSRPTEPQPHVGWPTSPSPTPPRPTQPLPTQPRPTQPSPPQHSSHPPSRPSGPTRSSPPTSPTTARPAEPRTGADQPVYVRPGDSLWLIAAQRLGADASAADVAAEWPRWYAANRTVIGGDPSLIQPGQVLHAPPTTTEPTD